MAAAGQISSASTGTTAALPTPTPDRGGRGRRARSCCGVLAREMYHTCGTGSEVENKKSNIWLAFLYILLVFPTPVGEKSRMREDIFGKA